MARNAESSLLRLFRVISTAELCIHPAETYANSGGLNVLLGDALINDRPIPAVSNAWPLELRLGIADALFSNTSEGLCITDSNQHIVEVNPTLCRLTGYSRSELLGKSPRIFSSGLQGPDFYAVLYDSLHETGQWTGELWNRHRTGTLYACRMNISAIRDGQGKVTHYLSIQADITSAKIQQERLEKSANYDDLTQLHESCLAPGPIASSYGAGAAQRTDVGDLLSRPRWLQGNQ